jgi:hypothetical protein
MLYDSDMKEFTDDTLVTVVTRMLHKTIQRLNDKNEPLWNVYVKTPKAKAHELELIKEEWLGKEDKKIEDKKIEDKKIIKEDNLIDDLTEMAAGIEEKYPPEEDNIIAEVKPVKKSAKKVGSFKNLKSKTSKKPVREKKEDPFYNPNKIF